LLGGFVDDKQYIMLSSNSSSWLCCYQSVFSRL